MKEIVEERNRIATTQEIKWGWLTISAILNYAEQHSGKWPTKWSDLIQDNSRKVDIDFTLQTSDLAKNPNLIYQAVRLKDHPELQDGLKPELTELRQQVLNAQGH